MQKQGNTSLFFLYDTSGIFGFDLIKNGSTTGTYYYRTDGKGEIIALTDSAGNVVANYTYDAWGTPTGITDANGSAITDSSSIGIINPIRYKGYCYDTETGLYYLNSRYYDPEVCRFISADDVSLLGADGSPLSYNLFTYCKNNPVMYFDFSGHAPEWWQWTISGAMMVAGIALVATGVGGVAGAGLICASANSIIGGYISETAGGSFGAGWIGGMITGAICGTGAGLAGNFLIQASNATGVACLGNLAAGGVVAFGSGAVGSAIGQGISSALDGKKVNKKEIVSASITTGAINFLSGIGAGIGTALQGLPAVSTTTTTLANSLNAMCSIVSESICDVLGILSSILPW